MSEFPQSRTEAILQATINGKEYTGLPESRIEELLLELKEVIEEGGGGGGTSTIAWKPTVAADGTISWVRTASETKPEDQNIKGPKGDTGETGAKGDTGETGSQGPKGDDGDPGLGIKLVSINQQGHLIITYDDDTTQDAGAIPGGSGAVDSVNGQTGVVVLDAEDVGALPDDTTIPTKTSDLTNDSGFQTASDVAAAISGKVDTSAVGTTVASLTDGKVPASQLPSYVDDVVEAEDVMHFPVTGESGKIYVALDTNKSYRWSGSGYVEISESLALGETSSTAYAGNKGKANADAIDAIKDGTTIDSFSDVESALADKVDKVSGKGLSENDYTTTEKNKLAGLANYDDTSISNRVSAIENVVPSDATSFNKLATQSDLPSAVVGNPSGSSTAGNLSKLQIGNDIYDVPSGGSSDPYDGRKIRYTINASNWSSSPNSDGYYTYSLTLTNPLTTSTSPNVYIAGASDSTQPTATEQTMFSYVKRCNLSSSTTLVLYASTKPTSTFYVFVGAEGGSGTLDYSYVVSNVSFTANEWTKIGDYTFPSTGIYALGLYPSGGSNNPKASMITYSSVTDPSALGTNDGYMVYAESGTVSCNCSCIKNCVANTKVNLFVKSNTTATNSVRVIVTRLADMA